MRTSKDDSGWKLSIVLSAPIARTCIVVCFKLPANGRAEAADASIIATYTERTKLAESCMVFRVEAESKRELGDWTAT